VASGGNVENYVSCKAILAQYSKPTLIFDEMILVFLEKLPLKWG
jgi:hypothetical protein